MSLAQEKIIKNYIYQIRAPFSLQEVHENTGVPKTSTFRILHNLLENGDIVKTCAAVRPQKYKAVIKVDKPKKQLRKEEVKMKAASLGVDPRTVYRMEKREETKESPKRILRKNLVKVMTMFAEKGKMSLIEVSEAVGGNTEKANYVVSELEDMGYLEKNGDSYNFVNNRRIS
jgi:DNA-binding Lrp family transcriptional regulator